MHPILFNIGPLTLHTYGLFVALGLFLGLRVAIHIARKQDFTDAFAEESLVQLMFYLVVSGFVGARLLYVVLFRQEFTGQWASVFKIWQGGLVFYGGLAGSVIGFLLWNRKQTQYGWKQVLDCLAPALALGHALGRLGCFFAGCCYGRPSDLPWAVVFTDVRCLAPLDMLLHPAQIYEFLFLAVLGIFLFWKGSRRIYRSGTLFADYLALYAAGRFFLEFLRDEPRLLWGGTAGQWVSFLLLAVSFIFRAVLSQDSSDSSPKRG